MLRKHHIKTRQQVECVDLLNELFSDVMHNCELNAHGIEFQTYDVPALLDDLIEAIDGRKIDIDFEYSEIEINVNLIWCNFNDHQIVDMKV